MEEKKPHWIHYETEDEHSVKGKRYLVSCTCSECGYHANIIWQQRGYIDGI